MLDENLIDVMQEKAAIEEHCKFICDLLDNYGWEDKRKQEILDRFNNIQRRKDDSKLYLGIVGEFSSGKTTFLNYLLGETFLKTNAIQGTTTVTTYIEYAERIGLSVKLEDGEILYYPKEKDALWELAGGHQDGEDGVGFLVRALTTNSVPGYRVKKVNLYHPSPTLKRGIVIIDTPGTDSLEKTHLAITAETVRQYCDLSLVMIPVEKPVTLSLSTFLEEYIPGNLHRCLFLLTKVETLRNNKEREMVRQHTQERLSTVLPIQQAEVFPAPTLLMLEEMKAIEPSGLLDRLSPEDRQTLSVAFTEALNYIFCRLEEHKHVIISEKLILLMNDLLQSLEKDLATWEEKYKDEKKLLEQNRIRNLDEFKNEKKKEYQEAAKMDTDKAIYKFRESYWKKANSAIASIQAKVQLSGSKREVADVLGVGNVTPIIEENLQSIQKLLNKKTDDIYDRSDEQYKNLSKEFSGMYSKLASLNKDSLKTSKPPAALVDDLKEGLDLSSDLYSLSQNASSTLGLDEPLEKVLDYIGGIFGSDFQGKAEDWYRKAHKYVTGEDLDEKFRSLRSSLSDQTGEHLKEYYADLWDRQEQAIRKKANKRMRGLLANIDQYMSQYADLAKKLIAEDNRKARELENLRTQVLRDNSSLRVRVDSLGKLLDLYKKL